MFTKKTSFWVIVRKRCGELAYLTKILTRSPVETMTSHLRPGRGSQTSRGSSPRIERIQCQPSIKAGIAALDAKHHGNIDINNEWPSELFRQLRKHSTMIPINDGYALIYSLFPFEFLAGVDPSPLSPHFMRTTVTRYPASLQPSTRRRVRIYSSLCEQPFECSASKHFVACTINHTASTQLRPVDLRFRLSSRCSRQLIKLSVTMPDANKLELLRHRKLRACARDIFCYIATLLYIHVIFYIVFK